MRLDPVEPRRRSRISEIVVGIVVVAACGLGVVLWQAKAASTQQVLVLARAVRSGEELTAGALRPADVRLGSAVTAVPVADADRVIGKLATTDLAAGTLVAPTLFTTRPAIPAGDTVVGAALTPGQFASFTLRPGAVVDAVRTGESGSAGDIVSARATVYEVRELKDTSGTWIVSLVVPEAVVAAVASAASAKHLTLALVGGTAP